jgi:hypothetical protein
MGIVLFSTVTLSFTFITYMEVLGYQFQDPKEEEFIKEILEVFRHSVYAQWKSIFRSNLCLYPLNELNLIQEFAMENP